MGLDIEATSKLVFARRLPTDAALEQLHAEFDARGEDLHEIYFVIHPNGRGHAARLRGTRTGLYTRAKGSRSHSFRAGSYSGYNWWRDQLARFAHGVPAEEIWHNPRRYRGGAFVELIDFSDCEGHFGALVSAKLEGDFVEYARKARPFSLTLNTAEEPNSGGYWLEVYRDFARAFKLAADGGALKFC
jgi:hypothetical protein